MLYTNTEPCPMCAGAIFWGNVGRVVFGLSMQGLCALIGEDNKERLLLPYREFFARGRKVVEVIGPVLESETLQVHESF